MKITLKRTEEQVELVKAMASKNRDVAYEAQVALAEFIGPVLAKVVNQAPTLSNLFSNFQFSADESPSIPMDLYYDITDEDYVTVAFYIKCILSLSNNMYLFFYVIAITAAFIGEVVVRC